MKHHLGYSALKVMVLLGALTVLLSGCFTARDDYRDKDRVDNDKLHQYDHWDTRDHDRP